MLFWISVYNLQASPTNNQKLQIQNCKFLMRGSSATLNESIKHCSYTTASIKRDVANNRIIEWSKIFTQIIEDIRMIEDIHANNRRYSNDRRYSRYKSSPMAPKTLALLQKNAVLILAGTQMFRKRDTLSSFIYLQT